MGSIPFPIFAYKKRIGRGAKRKQRILGGAFSFFGRLRLAFSKDEIIALQKRGEAKMNENIVEAYVGAQRKAIEEDKAMIGKISGLDVLPKSFESDFKKAYEEAEGTYGTVRSGCVELGGTGRDGTVERIKLCFGGATVTLNPNETSFCDPIETFHEFVLRAICSGDQISKIRNLANDIERREFIIKFSENPQEIGDFIMESIESGKNKRLFGKGFFVSIEKTEQGNFKVVETSLAGHESGICKNEKTISKKDLIAIAGKFIDGEAFKTPVPEGGRPNEVSSPLASLLEKTREAERSAGSCEASKEDEKAEEIRDLKSILKNPNAMAAAEYVILRAASLAEAGTPVDGKANSRSDGALLVDASGRSQGAVKAYTDKKTGKVAVEVGFGDKIVLDEPTLASFEKQAQKRIDDYEKKHGDVETNPDSGDKPE
jgi:hypothetical protein